MLLAATACREGQTGICLTVNPAKAVNATVLTLEDAPNGYQDFDKGAAKKFVFDPHGAVRKAA